MSVQIRGNSMRSLAFSRTGSASTAFTDALEELDSAASETLIAASQPGNIYFQLAKSQPTISVLSVVFPNSDITLD